MAETAQRWVPLESNPKVLNKYVHYLGMDSKWSFIDVYGLEPELLEMVPKPVAAIILLFPESKPVNIIGKLESEFPSDLYYTKQTIDNACGTVAIVHALANNQKQIKFDDTKHFKTFLEMTNTLNPEERAKFLEQDHKMGTAHDDCAQEGDTQAPPVDERVKSHFVAFINFNGILYELDGKKDSPVIHGETSPDTFLLDTAEVIKKFMARDPDNVNFNVMALARGGDSE